MTFKIEKNIPLRAPHKGRGAVPKYPYGQMDVNDSFFLEGETMRSNAVLYAYQYGARHNKKFAARVEDGGVTQRKQR